MSGSPAVFLDRDGTLIRDVGHLRRVEDMEILPKVPEAIRLFREQGLKVAVITNQSAVARGFLTEAELREIHRELERRLASDGAFLEGIYYCPHHPTEGLGPYRVACDCRKPNTGLARRAATELDLDVTRSYVVGDQPIDMELASRIGAKGVLLLSEDHIGDAGEPGKGAFGARDLWQAAQWVTRDLRSLR